MTGAICSPPPASIFLRRRITKHWRRCIRLVRMRLLIRGAILLPDDVSTKCALSGAFRLRVDNSYRAMCSGVANFLTGAAIASSP